jgi:hypothetical protein
MVAQLKKFASILLIFLVKASEENIIFVSSIDTVVFFE